MSMVDWRLSRLLGMKTFSDIVIPGSFIVVSQASRQRVGILCSASCSIPVDKVRLILGGNISFWLTAGDNTIMLSLPQHGPIVQGQVQIANDVSTAANKIISVVEYFLPEDYLAAALESYTTEYADFLQQPIERE